MLRINNLSKNIGEKTLLNQLDLNINQGEVLALGGQSGTGKTTLIRIISGLISFETGDVQIGKHKFNAKITYPQALYGQVGVVFQHHNLFPHLSALDNVSLALRKVKQITKAEAKLRALSELEHLGLSDQATQYPASLSGGERQRVAIARALAMDPLLLLLDEPTSGLDPQLINEVFRAIDSLASCGTTMLLITHNINFAKQTGSQFAILQDGKLKQSQDSNIFDQLNDFNSSK